MGVIILPGLPIPPTAAFCAPVDECEKCCYIRARTCAKKEKCWMWGKGDGERFKRKVAINLHPPFPMTSSALKSVMPHDIDRSSKMTYVGNVPKNSPHAMAHIVDGRTS